MLTNLVIDDDKTLNVVAGLIMPGPELFSGEPESVKLHTEHKTWVANSFLAKDVPSGINEIKYHAWDKIYLDYDIVQHKGSMVTDFLKENRNRIPNHLYLITLNPYGRLTMLNAMQPFYNQVSTINNLVIHLSERKS